MSRSNHPQRIAVTVPIQPEVEATLRHARWADDEGFDDVWFSDSGGVDALSLAAAVGAATRRVRIGTAVIPVYTRTPAVFAASAYSLHHACGGRFILGLGSSSQTMIMPQPDNSLRHDRRSPPLTASLSQTTG